MIGADAGRATPAKHRPADGLPIALHLEGSRTSDARTGRRCLDGLPSPTPPRPMGGAAGASMPPR